jgi:hypothetical protein
VQSGRTSHGVLVCARPWPGRWAPLRGRPYSGLALGMTHRWRCQVTPGQARVISFAARSLCQRSRREPLAPRDSHCSSRAGASRTGTRALASGWKRVRERKTGCSPVPLDVGMADALPLAKCRVLAAPDAGPALAAPPASPSRERPGPRQCRRVSRTCSFRGHRATSTDGFDAFKRCRFVRPQPLLGCGSRGEAWRGSRRRGWRRCSGSARGLARSRGCSCRWRVA